MSDATPPPLSYAMRRPHTRKAVWAWVGCALALGIGMPIAASEQILNAMAATEIELPLLTRWALELGHGLRQSLITLAWYILVALSSVPGFVSRNPRMNRYYLVGAGMALATLLVLAGSVHLTASQTLHALEPNASEPAPLMQPAPPQRR